MTGVDAVSRHNCGMPIVEALSLDAFSASDTLIIKHRHVN